MEADSMPSQICILCDGFADHLGLHLRRAHNVPKSRVEMVQRILAVSKRSQLVDSGSQTTAWNQTDNLPAQTQMDTAHSDLCLLATFGRTSNIVLGNRPGSPMATSLKVQCWNSDDEVDIIIDVGDEVGNPNADQDQEARPSNQESVNQDRSKFIDMPTNNDEGAIIRDIRVVVDRRKIGSQREDEEQAIPKPSKGNNVFQDLNRSRLPAMLPCKVHLIKLRICKDPTLRIYNNLTPQKQRNVLDVWSACLFRCSHCKIKAGSSNVMYKHLKERHPEEPRDWSVVETMMVRLAFHDCVVRGCGKRMYADVQRITQHVRHKHGHDIETYRGLVKRDIQRQRRNA